MNLSVIKGEKGPRSCIMFVIQVLALSLKLHSMVNSVDFRL